MGMNTFCREVLGFVSWEEVGIITYQCHFLGSNPNILRGKKHFRPRSIDISLDNDASGNTETIKGKKVKGKVVPVLN
jgi:hypothetical protein